MFRKLLVANRGEIACRVLRTAHRLGLRTVAVCSEADTGARHVRMADEARSIGPAEPSQSYLSIPAIVEAARASGADAVHPGYGFLSENADFAQACLDAGLIWVGPSPQAIRIMGSKAESKSLVQRAGVPVVPGYHGQVQSDDVLSQEARRIGLPVLIKASAGGGGRGMRIVRAESDLPEALASARREARAAFADDRLLVEKYVERPRHVEVQVFGDSHGNVVHLFERDCSIQRRHQKVIEESPAPHLSQSLRSQLGDAAVAAAQAVGYVGAGTVEFILDPDGSFFFLEMNTRLQVEHPVTELVTDQDLVEWQLRVAAGERLPLAQDELTLRGHAIEARLYAEDPAAGFLPSSGRVEFLRLPQESVHVRVDAGVDQGDDVTVHYDPLIAKIVVWGSERAAAVRRLAQALAAVRLVGPTSNRDFLSAVASHPAFGKGLVDTGFIERHRAALLPPAATDDDTVVAIAALYVLLDRERRASAGCRGSDAWSPWAKTTGWRLNHAGHDMLTMRWNGREDVIRVTYGDRYTLELPGGAVEVRGEFDESGDLIADIGGRRGSATVVQRGAELVVMTSKGTHKVVVQDPHDHGEATDGAAGHIGAPMPGRVIALPVSAGTRVRRGTPLFVMEAMKMEHSVYAPSDGVVEEIRCAVGDVVQEGAELITFVPEANGSDPA